MDKRIGIINMGFASGSETQEAFIPKLYKGVAPVKLLGVNMEAAELKKYFPDRDYEAYPVNYKYVKEGEAPGVFVTFQIQVDAESPSVAHLNTDGNFNLITRCAVLVKNEAVKSERTGKIQVINAFGQTGWMLPEEFQNKTLPAYMQKQNYLTEGMRMAYVGEENLIKILKMFINIPNTHTYNEATKVWTVKTAEELKACRAGFSVDTMKQILSGNVKEVREAIKYQPNNKIKFLFGVRTTSDNKQFQDILSRIPINIRESKYNKLNEELMAMKAAGSYASTDFGEHPFPFIEHVVKPTSFNADAGSQSVDPFSGIPTKPAETSDFSQFGGPEPIADIF